MSVGVVRLLGPVQFVDGHDVDIALRSVSMRRLLAVLAVSRAGPLRTAYLVDLLGVTPSAFRTSVSRLRARIGDEAIRSDATGYRLDCGGPRRGAFSVCAAPAFPHLGPESFRG